MRRLVPVFAALALFCSAGLAQAQESPVDKALKTLTEKVQQLEKKVDELTKKLEEAKPLSKLEDAVKGLMEKFEGGGGFDFDGLFEELRKAMPEMPEMPGVPGLPDLESLPDLLEGLKGMDFESLMEPLKGMLEEQFGEFFDGAEPEKLFEKFEKFFKPQEEHNDDDDEIYWL